MKDYRICTKCIMDTSDPYIQYDERGQCSHCQNFYQNILPSWHPNEERERSLMPLVERIKRDGAGQPHDCIMGISGGLDSSYAAFAAKERFGLRPLLYHVDAGWNSQQAVENVEQIVDGLGLDLYTEVINWEEMKDLQLAFFRSQVADQDLPQDLAFFSSLHNYAAANGIKFIVTGGNHSTECVREPIDWGAYYGTDLRYVRCIHGKFGQRPLTSFPLADIFRYKIYNRFVKGVRVVKILDHVRYVKAEAEATLQERFGWQPFQHKHHESRFTRFFESYWLPRKFGYEKRRAHFSSLILTGQMSRAAALDRIVRPELPEDVLQQEFDYVAKKLDLARGELEEIFRGENRSFRDYRNNFKWITLGTRFMQLIGVERRRFK